MTPAKDGVSLRDLQVFLENVITVMQDVPPENVLNADETSVRNDFRLGKVSAGILSVSWIPFLTS